MSKPKKSEQFRDVTPYWPERGYRPEIAAIPPVPNEDPKGEYAYQRAFLEAAQSNPPRLPNPNHYPNSESARAYMRKRSMEFLPSRVDKRPNEAPQEPHYTNRKFRDPDQLPPSVKKSASTSPASNYSSSSLPPAPTLMSIQRYEEKPNIQYSFQPQLPQMPRPDPPRLGVLEPKMNAPSGPTNKLR